jgi:hypothetical protein
MIEALACETVKYGVLALIVTRDLASYWNFFGPLHHKFSEAKQQVSRTK